jgi:hypothetical protein
VTGWQIARFITGVLVGSAGTTILFLLVITWRRR